MNERKRSRIRIGSRNSIARQIAQATLVAGLFAVLTFAVTQVGSMQERFGSAEDRLEALHPDAVTKLVAGSPRTNDLFGSSVAVSGDTAIVGAPVATSGSPNNNGTAYVYVRNGAGWTLQQQLSATDSPSDDRDGFGFSVAISGDTVIVGAPRRGDQSSGDDYGAAYVFARNGSTWALQKKLSPTDTPLAECESEFGKSVAISGDTAVVATNGCVETSENESIVHVFVRGGSLWSPQAMLLSPAASGDDFFGTSVALQGDMAIIGDPGDATGTRPETASVFYRCGTVWTRQQTLSPSDGASTERSFGGSVAMSGNSVVIGAKEDRVGNRIQGAAYVFTSDGTTWTQQQKLTVDDGGTSSRFGTSVAIFGNIAVVGKPQNAIVPANQGSAFAFSRSGTAWALQETFTASDGQAGDEFGSSVALSSNVVIVGARLDDAGATQTNEGSAYAIDKTTAQPATFSPPCETSIIVNRTSDEPDANTTDDICDVDIATSGQQCSLRAAIQTANAKSGPDEIKFNIPGSGVQTISPASTLPPVTEKVFINGTTQPGYAGDRPLIEISGTFLGSGAIGLSFASGSNASQVKALTINRFGAVGIDLQSNDNVVEKVFIGTSSDGLRVFEDSQSVGIKITGARNRIGAGDRTELAPNSTIAGSTIAQIRITSATAIANVIVGSNIGRLVDGQRTDTSAGLDGIEVEDGASNNQIGGNSNGAINDISGVSAVDIRRSNGTIIIRNRIAFCVAGVFVLSSDNTVIGGTRLGQLNSEGNEFDMNEVGVRVDSEAPPEPRTADLAGFEFAPNGSGLPSRNTRILGNTFRVSDPALVPQGRPTTAVGVADAEDTLIGVDQTGFENNIGDYTIGRDIH
ncbi:MAG: CSLREA domain-containing protein [Pyrinomonadaceae bacterium]